MELLKSNIPREVDVAMKKFGTINTHNMNFLVINKPFIVMDNECLAYTAVALGNNFKMYNLYWGDTVSIREYLDSKEYDDLLKEFNVKDINEMSTSLGVRVNLPFYLEGFEKMKSFYHNRVNRKKHLEPELLKIWNSPTTSLI